MKSFFKIFLLAVIDAATLYLSYYVSYLAMQLMGMQGTETFISNAYIFVPVKLIIYVIFLMYSLNAYRSVMLDLLGVLAANAATIFAANYLYQLVIQDNIIYFAIVLVFDGVIAVMVRYLIRNSGNSYEDDDDYDENFQNKQGEENSASIFDVNNFNPQPQPPAQVPPAVTAPDPKVLEEQMEKDRKIDMLMSQLDEKEQRIQVLENKLAMQSNMAYQNYSSSENYIDHNKKEILDKILDDIKSLYSTLNSRTKLVEEREYNLLLKMVELEEKQRALDLIQNQNKEDFPERSGKYQRKRIHNATYPTPLALPRDNPNLANNIKKTLDILNSSSAVTPPIVLAAGANDEAPPADHSKTQPVNNKISEINDLRAAIQQKNLNKPISQQPVKPADAPIIQQPVKKIENDNIRPSVVPSPKALQTELSKPQNIKPPVEVKKVQAVKGPVKPAVDFNKIKTNKVELKTEELDQISSLIDIL